jgi:hypothetical protein
MPELKKGMRLYHGSYCEVSDPDLSKCARYKDFGQGFYLTSSREQALRFSKISTTKAVGRNLIQPQRYGVVSVYTCMDPCGLAVWTTHPQMLIGCIVWLVIDGTVLFLPLSSRHKNMTSSAER